MQSPGNSFISTGHLPPVALVDTIVTDAYERFKSIDEGKVADYIPVLGKTSPELFGLCVMEVNGVIHVIGDTEYPFSIQSISKPFVFALICQAIGEDEAKDKLGVNSTGLPFNSVIAIERTGDGITNPMVNAGAIATTLKIHIQGKNGEPVQNQEIGLFSLNSEEYVDDIVVHKNQHQCRVGSRCTCGDK